MNTNNILGYLLGAAAGDALGSATELKSPAEIAGCFGGRVERFETPPADSLAAGRRAGQVTDAFSILYHLAEALVAGGGRLSKEAVEASLLRWAETEWFEPFAGMTTRKVINRLRQDDRLGDWAYAGQLGNRLYKGHYYAMSSNGAATKAGLAGLLFPGRPERAVETVCAWTMASHDDVISLSGAAAAAAAVSEAIDAPAAPERIFEAACRGAEAGENLARETSGICLYPGPSVARRLDLARRCCLQAKTEDEIAEELRLRVGSGPHITETLPIALGLFLNRRGRPLAALFDAVNVGDETSAIASIVGGLVGAMHGAGAFPDDYLATIERENGFDLEKLAEDLAAVSRQINA